MENFQDRKDFMRIDLVEEERERIKEIFIRKIESLINSRKDKKKYHSQHSIPLSIIKKLPDNFFFLIDNPNYMRLGERVKELEKKIIELRDKEGVF